jgi:hypothetical protein
MKNIVKPVSFAVEVERILVTIEPILTRDGIEITELSVRGGRVGSVARKDFAHMGPSFIKEHFTRDTVREINRVGKSEWKRVLDLIDSL